MRSGRTCADLDVTLFFVNIILKTDTTSHIKADTMPFVECTTL